MTAIAAGSITSPSIPNHRFEGHGRTIMTAAEDWLRDARHRKTAADGPRRQRRRSTPSIRSLGYYDQERVVFAKWLDGREPTP